MSSTLWFRVERCSGTRATGNACAILLVSTYPANSVPLRSRWRRRRPSSTGSTAAWSSTWSTEMVAPASTGSTCCALSSLHPSSSTELAFCPCCTGGWLCSTQVKKIFGNYLLFNLHLYGIYAFNESDTYICSIQLNSLQLLIDRSLFALFIRAN